MWDLLQQSVTWNRWAAKRLLWRAGTLAGNSWPCSSPQRILGHFFFPQARDNDFMNTFLTPIISVLPFIVSQIFTQKNWWIFYYNAVKGAQCFILTRLCRCCCESVHVYGTGQHLPPGAGLAALPGPSESPGRLGGPSLLLSSPNTLQCFKMLVFILSNRKK